MIPPRRHWLLLHLIVLCGSAAHPAEPRRCPPSATISALAYVTDPVGLFPVPGLPAESHSSFTLRLPASGGVIALLSSRPAPLPLVFPPSHDCHTEITPDTLTLICTEN